MITNEEQKSKSRIIPIYEYFEVLQMEWICADLRLKIYKRIKDKNYYKKVCDGKKIKIESIATKNSLPTIFNDEDLYLELKKRIYRDISFPNFIYFNNQDKILQGHWDLYYYFYPGSEVRFDLFSESKIGHIKSFDPLFPSIVVVNIKDEVEDFPIPIEKVTRIL